MRSDEDLGMLDQREVGGRRFGIEGINGCAAKLAAGERLDQGGLVDQAAPRAVDDSHRWLHHADRAGVDEVARLGIERRVQRDEVAAGPELVEPRHALDPILERLLGREQRVETDHGHAEAEGAPGHGEADPAQADHARVLPSSWVPVKALRSHFPDLRLSLATATLRARASISAMVCSAVETVLPPGVFMTTMPWRVAAGTSMLSTPTPARTMALSRAWFWRTSAVNCVPDRTAIPSAS